MIDYEVWINGKTYRALVVIPASRTLFMMMPAHGGSVWVVGCVKDKFWSVTSLKTIHVSAEVDKLGEPTGPTAFWQAYDLLALGINTEHKLLESNKSQTV